MANGETAMKQCALKNKVWYAPGGTPMFCELNVQQALAAVLGDFAIQMVGSDISVVKAEMRDGDQNAAKQLSAIGSALFKLTNYHNSVLFYNGDSKPGITQACPIKFHGEPLPRGKVFNADLEEITPRQLWDMVVELKRKDEPALAEVTVTMAST